MAFNVYRRKRGGPAIVLYMLCLVYLITYIDRVNLSTAAPMIKSEFGLTNTQLGLIFASFGYSYTAFQIIGGWMADKFGARRTLFFFGLIWSVSTFMTGLVGGVISLAVARLILGIGEGATFPAATRAIRQWVPASKWGLAQGLTHAASRFGTAIAPPLVVALMIFGSWREPFYILGAVSITWSIAWFIYYRDDPRTHRNVTEEEAQELAQVSSQKAKVQVTPWRALIAKMLPVSALYFCYAWCVWVYLSWIPSMLKESFSLNIQTAAFYSAGVLLAGVLGDFFGGVLTDRLYKNSGNPAFARKALIIFSMLGAVCCLSGLMFTRGLVPVTLLLCGGFFLLELTVAPAWSLPMDIAPESAGAASGLMNMGGGVAGIFSPFAFGFILDRTHNWLAPFWISIGVLLCGALIAWRLKITPSQAKSTESAADDVPVPAKAH